MELFGADPGPDRKTTVRQLSEVDPAIEEFHLARRRVLRDFQSRVDVMEGRLPSSRLSGED